MGGHWHLAIPQNGILHKNEHLMKSHPVLKGNFSCVTRVAAHSRFYCSSYFYIFPAIQYFISISVG